VRGKGGRSVHIHPQEALLQQARAFQNSDAFRPYRALRQWRNIALPAWSNLGCGKPAIAA
jgi:hypothetical protein